ncbi:antitoxin [Kaistia algarum]|uniref:type II toxin-antitoxin system Phd/YefM family antitoxin n=1 Tax=Kaistia algarum TaxID=2083279 RepID=UPI000CE74B79|nr:type II toxin-antitoxin system Phd/YefM family antitoxin [Kaistia algarum]MCX5512376.1 type II toxin-antitoxin system Phd/YefM family antitoxin [Kaistia algarum]PPE80457.1 antitoxin [Kaistia algarum]
MIRVKMHEAKTNLSKLAALVEAGEEITVMRGDKPVMKLVPISPPAKALRVPGRFKGVFELDDRFFEPLPDEELEAWNNPK